MFNSLWMFFVTTAAFAAPLPPELYSVPTFKLVDQDGLPVKNESFLGSVWIADFFYTSCLHECLMMTTKMQNLQGHLKDLKNVRFLSITTDPKVDTAKVLKSYAKTHKIDETNWRFVRGDKNVIVDLATKGFKLAADKKTAIHSQKFVLVDTKGKIRGYYDSEDKDELKKLEADIRAVLK